MQVDQFMEQLVARSDEPIPAWLLEFTNASLLEFLNSLKLGSGLKIGLLLWLFQAFVNAVLVFPFIAVILGFSHQKLSQTTYPGQRLRHSYRNSMGILLSMALLSASILLIHKFAPDLFYRLTDFRLIIGLVLLGPGLNLMLYFAVASGLIGWIRFGGTALLQHYALRFIAVRRNYLPWHLIPFLDYCVDRIFLRRVGGGYIFVHRLLMEHFAAMRSDGEMQRTQGMAAPAT
jgi:hypothetical protein